MLCVDGSHLKCGGAYANDYYFGCQQSIISMAFAVVDYENNNSWMHFMVKLKKAIGEFENLVFVSDQHKSIAHACLLSSLKHIMERAHTT